MEKTKEKNVSVFFALAILLIILDQISKQWIRSYFGITNSANSYNQFQYDNIKIIGDFLQFVYVENEGMAFGISFGAAKVFLSLFSVVASIALSWYLIRIKEFSAWVKLGIAFILAGAAGNLIDRVFYGVIFNYAPLFYGRVIDFVQFDIPDINFGFIQYSHFPVFNIADSCVTVGVVLLILSHNRIPTLSDIKKKQSSDSSLKIEDSMNV